MTEQKKGTEQVSAKQKTLKVGMIGIGMGAAEILPAFDALEQIELVAGADLNPVTLRAFQERYPKVRTYESAEALCADPNVDAVWISTPNKYHAPQSILAAGHG